ncbi:TetR/AcrR family transcriptional regulator [Silvibacterium sp.]|uniref:TetR/AcrR family transcriptional regulator n=1 Tax=Silvibacterium sp. TaxID=1964179 RepID=UPI0039E6FDA7
MAKKRSTHEAVQPRKTPLQRRSVETVVAVLESSARILESHGFEGFNTNAIAERAGVSIGSLYQYFPNKDALLSALIERETAALLASGEEFAHIQNCKEMLRAYIGASIRHQMRRPRLARLLDIAEQREAFQPQVSQTVTRLQSVMENALRLPGAPKIENHSVAAGDILALIRGLVDAAGERGERASPELAHRVEGAVWGYLRSSESALEGVELHDFQKR